MRRRMREELDGSKANEFDLKQGVGGIVDIEFMVQYAVLAWSHQVPALADWSDNVRILETLGREGLFTEAEAQVLTEAYLAYRSAAHQLALQQQPGVAPAQDFSAARASVVSKWDQLLGNVPLPAED